MAWYGDWQNLVLAGSCALNAVFVYSFVKKTFAFPFKAAPDAPKESKMTDTVACYVMPGSSHCVSASPFSTKVILYCRLAGLPHTVDKPSWTKNPKGKIPYIIHGGHLIGDSQLIIRYLENTFDIAASSKVSAEKFGAQNPFVPFKDLDEKSKSMSEAVRLLCETEIYWAGVSSRWLGSAGIARSESEWKTTVSAYFSDIPGVIRGLIARMLRVNVTESCWRYGLARHSPADQLYLATRALRSLSTLLGDKPFFLGAFPSECDTIAYAIIECMMDTTWSNPLAALVLQDPSLQNLVDYAHRVRKQYLGDLFVEKKD